MTIAASSGGAGDGAGRRVVSKAEFSRMIGRSKAAVTGYVKDRKLSGAALVDDEGVEKIDVDVALRQLDLTLDPIQRAAQASTAAAVQDLPLNDDQRRLVRANAEIKETQSLRARADLLASNGNWVHAGEVRSAWGRRLAELLMLIEAEFPTVVDALAKIPPGDRRAMTLELRKAFRQVRQRVADRMGVQRDAMEQFAETEDVSA